MMNLCYASDEEIEGAKPTKQETQEVSLFNLSLVCFTYLKIFLIHLHLILLFLINYYIFLMVFT